VDRIRGEGGRARLPVLLGVALAAAITLAAYRGVMSLSRSGAAISSTKRPPTQVPTTRVSASSQQAPHSLLAPGFIPASVSFFDGKRGLVAGRISEEAGPFPGCDQGCRGLIGITADGGHTWKVIWRGPWAFDDLTTFGDRFAWATLGGCGSGSRCSRPVVFMSSDGGANWRAISDANVARFSFVSPLEGWGIEPHTDFEPRPLLRTDDGGRTWRHLPDPCPKGLYLQDLSFVSGRHGWVLCDGEPSAGQQSKAILETTDGGRVWHTRSAVVFPPDPKVVGKELPSSGYGEGIVFLPDGHGWLWMSREYSYRTTDGGRAWKPMEGIADPDVREPVAIWFGSASSGFVLLGDSELDTTLLHTVDGGVHWDRIF
jgi:photosystem II stability/assembly factor-like uncharacterized protein